MHRREILKGVGAAALTLPMAQAALAANGLPQSAPIRVGEVGLRTRDAQALSAWYQQAVGLQELSRDGDTIRLGAGGQTLLVLTERSGLTLAPDRRAGLYHTAFLLPSRRDLAMWISMAIDRRLPVDGTADHRVSEAIYLTDPEGNGVEIYADRPQDSWQWVNGQVEMGSYRMDVEGIMSTLGLLPPIWRGAPAGTTVGHVHLKVGNARQAGRWWQQTLGFDAVRAREDAVFLSTGGYHHHIAVNEWMSAGAGRRPDRETGLDYVQLLSRAPGTAARFEDDWGTAIRLG